ncbi:unnamed protein product [Caenorhabditis bovis]|uniref:Ground-like domain-containing protein n=1 Tax=Caenorhabditis bovis TaxID=2654633 RepID=A0A8S1EG23_9PELO|nr:unnamed protein product [Caenorhabditis bovis]
MTSPVWLLVVVVGSVVAQEPPLNDDRRPPDQIIRFGSNEPVLAIKPRQFQIDVPVMPDILGEQRPKRSFATYAQSPVYSQQYLPAPQYQATYQLGPKHVFQQPIQYPRLNLRPQPIASFYQAPVARPIFRPVVRPSAYVPKPAAPPPQPAARIQPKPYLERPLPSNGNYGEDMVYSENSLPRPAPRPTPAYIPPREEYHEVAPIRRPASPRKLVTNPPRPATTRRPSTYLTTPAYVEPTTVTYVEPTTVVYAEPTTTTTTTRRATTTTPRRTTRRRTTPRKTTTTPVPTTTAVVRNVYSPPPVIASYEPLPVEVTYDETYVGQYYYGKKGEGNVTFPLPSCFFNPSGYVCCNLMLNELMSTSYEQTFKETKSKCNIQKIANKLQTYAESIFASNFETIVSLEDFSQKIHFRDNLVCKIEVDGKFILAYGTPYSVDPKKIIPTVPAKDGVQDSANLRAEVKEKIENIDKMKKEL